MLSLRAFFLISVAIGCSNKALCSQGASSQAPHPLALHTLIDHKNMALTHEKLGSGNNKKAGENLSDAAHAHTSIAIKMMKEQQDWQGAANALHKATDLHLQSAEKSQKNGDEKKAKEEKMLAETTKSMADLAKSHGDVRQRLAALDQSSNHTREAEKHLQEAMDHQKKRQYKMAADAYRKAMVAHQAAAAAHELGGAKLSDHREKASNALIEHHKMINQTKNQKRS